MTPDVLVVPVLQAFLVALCGLGLSMSLPLLCIWIVERWTGRCFDTDRWLELPGREERKR